MSRNSSINRNNIDGGGYDIIKIDRSSTFCSELSIGTGFDLEKQHSN